MRCGIKEQKEPRNDGSYPLCLGVRRASTKGVWKLRFWADGPLLETLYLNAYHSRKNQNYAGRPSPIVREALSVSGDISSLLSRVIGNSNLSCDKLKATFRLPIRRVCRLTMWPYKGRGKSISKSERKDFWYKEKKHTRNLMTAFKVRA